MMPTLLPITETQTDLTDETDSVVLAEAVSQATDFTSITNDAFLAEIFGTTFVAERPLVCSIEDDPENKGWSPESWPCDTSNANVNRYVAPSVFMPNEQVRYRAQKRLGRCGVDAL